MSLPAEAAFVIDRVALGKLTPERVRDLIVDRFIFEDWMRRRRTAIEDQILKAMPKHKE